MGTPLIAAGSTSVILEVVMRDSTTGAGKTALAHTDVTASYCRAGATRTAISLSAGTAGDAYSSGKWAQVDATNMKGVYQLHIPNAALAAGVGRVTIGLQATGAIDKELAIELGVASSADNATAVAAAILETPANLLATDATGQVTTGAIAANAITATAIATDAIDAAAVKADAVTKIAAGVDTSLDCYTATGKMIRGTSADQYIFSIALNGVPVAQASITSVALTVLLKDDTSIVTAGTPTEFGTYSWSHNESTTRLTAGQAVECAVTFVISGVTYVRVFETGRNA